MGGERSTRSCCLAEQPERGRPRDRPRQLISHTRMDALRPSRLRRLAQQLTR